jgi:lactate permease
MAGRQLPIFSFIVPVWLVWVMAGWRGVLGVWPALLVCGGSFAAVQFVVANYHGPWLVDVAGGLISLCCLALFLNVWQPATTWRFPDETATSAGPAGGPSYSRPQIISAWVPWILLSAFVFIWGIPQVKTILGAATRDERKAFALGKESLEVHPTYALIQVPALHRQIERQPPVVSQPKAEDAIYEANVLSATGTGIFLAAVVSACWLGIGPGRFLRVFRTTCHSMRWPLFTIACMLAIAYVTRFSGMDATMGLAFTHTGGLYPVFAALLGWLGVALTGSDTSSNALFGSLQIITASSLAQGNVLPLDADKASLLLAAANSTGGVMGKMIDAQSIVVAAVATGQHNQEGPILRFVFWHSLVLAVLMGLLVLYQAYHGAWMIP